MQPPDSRQRWVSFDEARMILRMSEGTLRRAIREGKVTAEQRRRSPDSATDLRMVYEVLVTDPPAPASHSESMQAPDIRQDTPAVTDALVAALDDERAERQRIAAENAELRERVGRAETRADLLAAQLAESQATLAHERAVSEARAADLERERRRSWLDRVLGRWPTT